MWVVMGPLLRYSPPPAPRNSLRWRCQGSQYPGARWLLSLKHHFTSVNQVGGAGLGYLQEPSMAYSPQVRHPWGHTHLCPWLQAASSELVFVGHHQALGVDRAMPCAPGSRGGGRGLHRTAYPSTYTLKMSCSDLREMEEADCS